MSLKKVLVINAAWYIGGDIAMWLLGLPALDAERFRLYAVSIPRGKVYAALRSLPNVSITPMELGGKELHPAARFSKPIRALEAALAIPRIANLVKREKIDVIYSIDRTVSMPISYLVSVITRCPLVVNAQISHYLTTSILHRRVIKHAARLTVSSENMRANFLPYVDHPNKLVTIPNAITFDRYDPTLPGSTVRAEFGIAPDAPVVVLAGRLSPFKGQDDLIRAAGIILKERPDTYFLLAGRENAPGFQAYLENLIAELQVGHRVKLIGHRTDLPNVIASANVSTMPSHEEPFGLVALEAMAMGKPVVATRAGGVPEFLVDGEMGLLIPPRDYEKLARSILELINDPERARAMGIRGRQHVEQFYTEKTYGQKLANFLFDVVNDVAYYTHPQPVVPQK